MKKVCQSSQRLRGHHVSVVNGNLAKPCLPVQMVPRWSFLIKSVENLVTLSLKIFKIIVNTVCLNTFSETFLNTRVQHLLFTVHTCIWKFFLIFLTQAKQEQS